MRGIFTYMALSGGGLAGGRTGAKPDFQALFESAPGCFLVLDPRWRIVAVSDAYLSATMTERGAIVGRYLFDVFPDNPDDPSADGVAKLSASLNRVAQQLQTDTMADQHYDVRRPDDQGGGFEVRYWSPMNSPVLDQDGNLLFIIHRVEDVTDRVRAEKELQIARENELVLVERDRIGAELNDRVLVRISANTMHLASAMERTNDRDVVHMIKSVMDDLDATIVEIRSTVFTDT